MSRTPPQVIIFLSGHNLTKQQKKEEKCLRMKTNLANVKTVPVPREQIAIKNQKWKKRNVINSTVNPRTVLGGGKYKQNFFIKKFCHPGA